MHQTRISEQEACLICGHIHRKRMPGEGVICDEPETGLFVIVGGKEEPVAIDAFVCPYEPDQPILMK